MHGYVPRLAENPLSETMARSPVVAVFDRYHEKAICLDNIYSGQSLLPNAETTRVVFR